MSVVSRTKFLQALKLIIDNGDVKLPDNKDEKQLLNLLYHKDWVVYAKAPFGGHHAVIEYLARYTHKVAISNHRICNIEDDTVTFEYKDYADDNKQKRMTLTAIEFIRRFEQHILPERFTKIRTYGYLANRNRRLRINEVLKKMKLPLHKGLIKIPLPLRTIEQYGTDLTECLAVKQNNATGTGILPTEAGRRWLKIKTGQKQQLIYRQRRSCGVTGKTYLLKNKLN